MYQIWNTRSTCERVIPGYTAVRPNQYHRAQPSWLCNAKPRVEVTTNVAVEVTTELYHDNRMQNSRKNFYYFDICHVKYVY